MAYIEDWARIKTRLWIFPRRFWSREAWSLAREVAKDGFLAMPVAEPVEPEALHRALIEAFVMLGGGMKGQGEPFGYGIRLWGPESPKSLPFGEGRVERGVSKD